MGTATAADGKGAPADANECGKVTSAAGGVAAAQTGADERGMAMGGRGRVQRMRQQRPTNRRW